MANTAKPFGRKGTAPKPRSEHLLRKRLLRYALIAVLVSVACTGIAAGIYVRSLYAGMPDLPERETLWTRNREPAIAFQASDGTVLDIRGPRYGREVRLVDLPPHIYHAFIAAEDKRFYQHNGADTRAIVRAAWSNWREGRTVSGASTITQQLVKNLVLSPEQTLQRKVQEMHLARKLEERLTKDEILELYINRAYFGGGFYGLSAAAEHYFGVEARNLTVGQATLLAGLVQAPSRLALTRNLAGAQDRQRYVLDEMVRAGYLSDSQADAAANAEINLVDRPVGDPQLGYVLDLAKERVVKLLPDAPPDLVVTLSIDPDLQSAVHAAIAEEVAAQGETLQVSQAAAMIVRPDGQVLALVGGVDYIDSEFNRATQAKRQPGSSFKPLVFAAALEEGIHPYDTRLDVPFKIGKWSPRNYTGGYRGTVTLTEAMSDSINTVSVILAQEVGLERVIRLARRFGMVSPFEPHPSIALGSEEVTLWELTRAYGVFMRGGLKLDPYLIAQIEDTRGTLLYEREPIDADRVFDRNLARDMTGMLTSTVASGTGSRAAIDGWTVAGKTGTSQDWRDAWFVGYTTGLVAGVWVGNDDNSPMDEVTGGGLPAELFAKIMSLALADQTAKPLEGADRAVVLSRTAKARVAYYRSLSEAFSNVAGRQVAELPAQR
ncbi:MAG: PBP1A family penicillin-binding protein [Pseudomonadota bacterium]